MALSESEIEYLMSPEKIRTCHLSDEARAFRDKYLKGVYKENRLQRDYLKRKAEMEGIELIDYTFVDWKSEEEFRDWFNKDRIERRQILDKILSEDDWLWKLALKYYPDNPEIVYADKETERNWKRHELPKKKRLNTDEDN